MFKDRTEAGIKLAEKLIHLKGKDSIVLAIPRGGLPLGAIIAKTINAPLDVVLTKKIGHPSNKEYAIGAVSLEGTSVLGSYEISPNYIEREIKEIHKKLKKRHDQYYKNSKPLDLENKVVIIVDDGIATGNTMIATIELVHKRRPKLIVVAIPVAPTSVIEKLKQSNFIDELICLEISNNFYAVGQFYENFFTVTDATAIKILQESNKDKITS